MGLGPVERVDGTLEDMHERVVASMGGGAGTLWLDVGLWHRRARLPGGRDRRRRRRRDLAPTLVETARRQAADRGLAMQFEVGDVEALPYGDVSVDIVTSSIGAIFAPDHAACGVGARTGAAPAADWP